MHNLLMRLILCMLVLLPVSAVAADVADDTMLMLIGEAEPVVTAASRFAESPLTAPAIVTLVNREQIERGGYRTLGDLLSDQPGFYIATAGRGSVVYYRGLRDAVLFLYDGVPITTDVTKSFAPLDAEFSLLAIEQVEIIKGPGSVLWGADAFAAVINIVPARGFQRPGLHARLTVGNLDQRAGSLSWGASGSLGNLFLAGKVSRERFHADRYQDAENSIRSIDNSRFDELVVTANFRDWLQLSGRWSDFERRFTMTDAASDLIWNGAKQTPFNYLKFSATGQQGPSHYTLSGFIQQTDYLLRDADVERRQRNRTRHLELLWDRRVIQRGLLTVGASWRRNDVDGALVRDGFLPDFLQPDLPLFTPNIEQRDFTNEIFSLFSQFRYRFGKSEWWLGGRVESHSDYDESFTGSFGYQTELTDSLHLKLVYGSAWRTPYSRQLFDVESLDQEQIRTLSKQLDWNPHPRHHYALTLFHSRIKYHRSEDPYGGLSLPSDREMFGGELSLQTPLTRTLSAHAGFSWVDGGQKDEHFRVLAFSIIRPDGGRTDVYDEWQQPYAYGPEWMARLGVDWSIGAAHNLRVGLRTGGDVSATFLKGTISQSYRTPIMADLTYSRPGVWKNRDDFTLRITNLFDKNYQRPDIYGSVKGEPLRISLTWQVRFW